MASLCSIGAKHVLSGVYSEYVCESSRLNCFGAPSCVGEQVQEPNWGRPWQWEPAFAWKLQSAIRKLDLEWTEYRRKCMSDPRNPFHHRSIKSCSVLSLVTGSLWPVF